jgi:hypothetical protein
MTDEFPIGEVLAMIDRNTWPEFKGRVD